MNSRAAQHACARHSPGLMLRCPTAACSLQHEQMQAHRAAECRQVPEGTQELVTNMQREAIPRPPLQLALLHCAALFSLSCQRLLPLLLCHAVRVSTCSHVSATAACLLAPAAKMFCHALKSALAGAKDLLLHLASCHGEGPISIVNCYLGINRTEEVLSNHVNVLEVTVRHIDW